MASTRYDFRGRISIELPIIHYSSNHNRYGFNLVPRSLVDKAEGEIWQSKKICFFDWLLHLTPVQSPLWKFTRFSAKNFLQTQVLTWKFPRLVKRNADKKRREEKIFGSNLPFGIEKLLQHDHTVTQIPNTLSSARSSSPPSPTHSFLTQQNFTNPSPCSQFFFSLFYFFALTRSPNLRTKTACRELISEAFQRDLAITREGGGFCKKYLRQKTCVGDRGELERARALDDEWNSQIMLRKANSVRQNIAKVAEILPLSQKYSKRNPAKL